MTGIVQASYGLNHGPAWVGMIADGQLSNVVSKINNDTVTIQYGKAVVRDGTAGGAKLPVAGSVTADIIGVAVRELNRAYTDGSTFGAVIDKDFSVMTVGTIWVTVAEAVAINDPAFVRVGATQTGDFCKTAGTGATLAVAMTGAKFLTAATAGNLAKLSIVVGG